MSKASMLDQISVRVVCVNCGPAEVPLANVKGKRSHACGRCGFEIRLDREPLRSHLAMLLSEAEKAGHLMPDKRSALIEKLAASPSLPAADRQFVPQLGSGCPKL